MNVKSFFTKTVILILVLKIVLLVLFSSDYQNRLFIPFITHFLQNFDNPWQYYYQNNLVRTFPYPPAMLYLFSIFYAPALLIPKDLPFLHSVFFRLPLLLSDILILWVFARILPKKFQAVTLFYFLSPIILYATYMHSQLDLVPTALLFLSLYLLMKKRFLASSLVFGLAVSTKFHVIAALPLVVIYLLKNRSAALKTIILYVAVPAAVYLAFALPFIFSPGYQALVLNNKEQKMIFDVIFAFRDLQIYLAPLAVFGLFFRFLNYRKVNQDLLFSFLGLLFAIFLALIPPNPGWYMWIVPFITIYFVNARTDLRRALILYGALSAAYIAYFVFFFTANNAVDLEFLGTPLTRLKIANPFLHNIAFTLLEGTLLAVIYSLYKYGVRSNSIYKQKSYAFTIGIGGDSGVGKSTTLDDIRQMIGSNTVLEVEGDGDHRWERNDENWKQITHLNPKANFLHRQYDNLMSLKTGKTIEKVDYDHASGKFSRPRKIDPNDYIILCGLLPFYLPKMRKNIDLKIYIDTSDQLRVHWKILRDIGSRGYSRDKVVAQIESRKEDSKKFILPQKEFADLVVNYFSDDLTDVGNPGAAYRIGLRLTVDSNVPLDALTERLDAGGFQLQHDYSEDLRNQYLTVTRAVSDFDYEETANQIIENKGEIIQGTSQWKRDLRGLVQLVTLLMISEKMKEDTGAAV